MKEKIDKLIEILQEAKTLISDLESNIKLTEEKYHLRKYDNLLLRDIITDTRTRNILSYFFREYGNIPFYKATVADLLQYTAQDILYVHYAGPKTLNYIRKTLASLGIIWEGNNVISK